MNGDFFQKMVQKKLPLFKKWEFNIIMGTAYAAASSALSIKI